MSLTDVMPKKNPFLVLFWANTRALLTYQEQRDLEMQRCSIVAFTPLEVLIGLDDGRKVVIRGVLDPGAPLPPPRKDQTP